MAVVYTKRVPDGLVVVIAQPSTAVEKAMTSVLLSTRCCSAAESRKLQKVRHRPAEWASITSPMPLLSSGIHRRAHEIALAELDPAMAQDVIRRCAVEIEVR